MKQLRVVADIDETDLGRVTVGEKVNINFRGSISTASKGTVARIAPAVKRMQLDDPELGSATEARVVEIEISFDDQSQVPKILGREAHVVFLR